MARPSKYTKALGTRICERIASGETLKDICASAKMPTRSTVYRWAVEDEEFSDMYARARERCADSWFEDALEIASSADQAEDPKLVPGARLHVDTLKWAAAKLRPRAYSERHQLEMSGPDGGPIRTQTDDLSRLSVEELQALRAIRAKLDADSSSGE